MLAIRGVASDEAKAILVGMGTPDARGAGSDDSGRLLIRVAGIESMAIQRRGQLPPDIRSQLSSRNLI